MSSQMRVGKTMKQLLAHLEPRIKQVLQVMSFSHTDIAAALSDRVRLSPDSKGSIADSMRAFKSSPGWSPMEDCWISTSILNTNAVPPLPLFSVS